MWEKKINKVYSVTMPNVYAVGLFVGTMTYEIADSCVLTCEHNDLVAEIDFKFKPMWGGSLNNVEGKIKQSSETIYKLSGKWSDQMFTEDKKVPPNDCGHLNLHLLAYILEKGQGTLAGRDIDCHGPEDCPADRKAKRLRIAKVSFATSRVCLCVRHAYVL